MGGRCAAQRGLVTHTLEEFARKRNAGNAIALQLLFMMGSNDAVNVAAEIAHLPFLKLRTADSI